MQTVINNTPVWVTHRSETDISEEEIKESLGYCPDAEEYFQALKDLSGYYFATCSPGCLPDSSFFGPYQTEEEAVKAATEFYND